MAGYKHKGPYNECFGMAQTPGANAKMSRRCSMRVMWGIQDPTQGQLLQTIGLSDNPNLYSSRVEAEAQAKRNGAEVIEVELKY